MRDRAHNDFMSEHLDADPLYAAELLADVLNEGSPAELEVLLNQLNRSAVPWDEAVDD